MKPVYRLALKIGAVLACATAISGEALTVLPPDEANRYWEALAQSTTDFGVLASAKLISGVTGIGVTDKVTEGAAAAAMIAFPQDRTGAMWKEAMDLPQVIREIIEKKGLATEQEIRGHRGLIARVWQKVQEQYRPAQAKQRPIGDRMGSQGEAFAEIMQAYWEKAPAKDRLEAKVAFTVKSYAASLDLSVVPQLGELSWPRLKEALTRDMPVILLGQTDQACHPYVCFGFLETDKGERLLCAFDPRITKADTMDGGDLIHPVDRAIGGTARAAAKALGGGITIARDYTTGPRYMIPGLPSGMGPGVVFLRFASERQLSIVCHSWKRDQQAVVQRVLKVLAEIKEQKGGEQK